MKRKVYCIWKLDDSYDGDTWESSCGEVWSFIEGGPQENGVKFCHNCGKPVKFIPASPAGAGERKE